MSMTLRTMSQREPIAPRAFLGQTQGAFMPPLGPVLIAAERIDAEMALGMQHIFMKGESCTIGGMLVQ